MGRSSRWVFAWAALCSVLTGPAAAESCSRADFEAAVSAAAEALRALNQANRPTFQARLRQLKAKRGWSHDQFLAEAAPIVQDQQIALFDDQSASFLARIEQLGSEGTTAVAPDCALLGEVREAMQSLVEVQKAKWAYMFQRLDAEIAR